MLTDAEMVIWRKRLQVSFAILARKSRETGIPAAYIITPTDEEIDAFVPAEGEAEAGLAAVQDWTAAQIIGS